MWRELIASVTRLGRSMRHPQEIAGLVKGLLINHHDHWWMNLTSRYLPTKKNKTTLKAMQQTDAAWKLHQELLLLHPKDTASLIMGTPTSKTTQWPLFFALDWRVYFGRGGFFDLKIQRFVDFAKRTSALLKIRLASLEPEIRPEKKISGPVKWSSPWVFCFKNLQHTHLSNVHHIYICILYIYI